MLFFHHSLQYLSRSTLRETQKVLGLLPSFLQFYIRLSFLLLTVNANVNSYRHEHLSPTTVLVISFGLFSCTVSVLVCILNSITCTFSAAYDFSRDCKRQTPLVILTDQERDPKQGPSFLHPLPTAHSQHLGLRMSQTVSEVFHYNMLERKVHYHGDTHWRT